jgi:hypothetical protein
VSEASASGSAPSDIQAGGVAISLRPFQILTLRLTRGNQLTEQ